MYSLTRRETERVNLLPSVRRSILNELEPSEKMVSGSVEAPPAVDSRSCWTATPARGKSRSRVEPVWRNPEQRFAGLIRSK